MLIRTYTSFCIVCYLIWRTVPFNSLLRHAKVWFIPGNTMDINSHRAMVIKMKIQWNKVIIDVCCVWTKLWSSSEFEFLNIIIFPKYTCINKPFSVNLNFLKVVNEVLFKFITLKLFIPIFHFLDSFLLYVYKQDVFSEHKEIILIFSKSSVKFYLNLFKVTLKLFIPIFHFLDNSLTFSLSFSILARSSMF